MYLLNAKLFMIVITSKYHERERKTTAAAWSTYWDGNDFVLNLTCDFDLKYQWKTLVSLTFFRIFEQNPTEKSVSIDWLVGFLCVIGKRLCISNIAKNKITVINDALVFSYSSLSSSSLLHKAIHNPLCNYPLKICNNRSWSVCVYASVCVRCLLGLFCLRFLLHE